MEHLVNNKVIFFLPALKWFIAMQNRKWIIKKGLGHANHFDSIEKHINTQSTMTPPYLFREPRRVLCVIDDMLFRKGY